MRLHTDTLAPHDIYAAETATDGAHVEDFEAHGSRKRRYAYEVKLAHYGGGKGTSHPYRRNSGQYGADGRDIWAATYDDWGWFILALFDKDPEMIFGPYDGVDDFHARTEGRYKRGKAA